MRQSHKRKPPTFCVEGFSNSSESSLLARETRLLMNQLRRRRATSPASPRSAMAPGAGMVAKYMVSTVG